MKNYLIIDLNKNTCEIESSKFSDPRFEFKNMKRNKTQKELLETVKDYLRGINKED